MNRLSVHSCVPAAVICISLHGWGSPSTAKIPDSGLTVVSDHGISLSWSTFQNFSPSLLFPPSKYYLLLVSLNCSSVFGVLSVFLYFFFFSSPMTSRFLKGGIPPSNYEISLVQVPVCTTGHETEGNRRSGFTHRCFLTFDDPLSASSSLTKPTKLLSESSSRRHKILSAYRAACSCFMRIFML